MAAGCAADPSRKLPWLSTGASGESTYGKMNAGAASDLVIVIPAAGASSRMRGADKLLGEIEGGPLLRVVAERALATGALVVVVLPETCPGRSAALAGLEIKRVTLPNHTGGMAASIRAGMAAVQDQASGVMILPADMPDLNIEHLQKVAERFSCDPEAVVRACDAAGNPGHPVIFPRRLFAGLRALPDGEGARTVLDDEDVLFCPLPGMSAVTDLDTPEDWTAWRTTQAANRSAKS